MSDEVLVRFIALTIKISHSRAKSKFARDNQNATNRDIHGILNDLMNCHVLSSS
jgi:hypothetical protein